MDGVIDDWEHIVYVMKGKKDLKGLALVLRTSLEMACHYLLTFWSK